MSTQSPDGTDDLRTVIEPAVHRWLNRDANGYEPPLPDAEEIAGGDMTFRIETEYGLLRVERSPLTPLDVASSDGEVFIGGDTADEDGHGFGWYMTPEQARALAEALLFGAELADREKDGTVF